MLIAVGLASLLVALVLAFDDSNRGRTGAVICLGLAAGCLSLGFWSYALYRAKE